MAHIAKYKAGAVGQMAAHWQRTREPGHYGNEHIDPSRTPQNYALYDCGGVWHTVAEAMANAPTKVRKDAVVCYDVVVTLPKDWPPTVPPHVFFDAVRTIDLGFLPGKELGAWIHMDETTPHMHHAFMPVDGDGRFAYKRLMPRDRYQAYHQALQDGVLRLTGVRCSILLPEEDQEQRALSYVPQADLDRTRKALQEATEAAERAEERVRALEDQKAALEAENAALRAEGGKLRHMLAALRQAWAELRALIAEDWPRVERLAERLSHTRPAEVTDETWREFGRQVREMDELAGQDGSESRYQVQQKWEESHE